ncbi:MAG: DUF4829 domain-containing protein [Bacillota bacterium]
MSLFDWLLGRRRKRGPAAEWMARRAEAAPGTVIREHFAAMVAHDLDWILATLTPERGRLYTGPTTIDKRRLSVRDARVLEVERAPEAPDPVAGYAEQLLFRVEFELELVPGEELRDPSLKAGRQWAYYLLVREKPGKPWLIADWGR